MQIYNSNYTKTQFMTRIFVFMIFLILLSSCKSEEAPVKFTGKEAQVFDRIKKDFQSPQYKWGYLNKNGELAITDKYDDLREFNEDLAVVNIDGLWGYVDKSGSSFLPPRFLTANQFSEGRASVQDLVGGYHIYDKKANLIIDSLKYDNMNKFCSGRALVMKNRKYGYLDKSGNVAIELLYDKANDFKNGLAIVSKDQASGFIDSLGNIVIPLIYDKIYHPKSGLIRYKKNGKFGFINLDDGSIAFSGFINATDFQGGFAVINDGDKYFLLNQKGQKTSLPYSLVDMGGEGKWMYAANAKFGFLNNDGAPLCPPQYDLVMRYKENRAGFAINDVWGYLDESGQIVIPPKFPLVWDFVNGYARMIGKTGFGFIDKNGESLLPAQYMEVRDFSEGLARIQVYR